MSWHVGRRTLMAGVFAIVSLAAVGCGIFGDDERKNYEIVDGPVGDLYQFCIESGCDPYAYEYEVFLYWDHLNIPTPNHSYPYLRMKNTPSSEMFWSTLGFDYYEYEDIPEDSGFPESPGPGWKVRIWGAAVEFCQTCYTDDGLLRLIHLTGPKDNVEFVWDPGDSLATYVRWTLIE